MDLLTRIEELILLSVWKLQDEAYGLAIRNHLSEMVGSELSVGAVYVPLKRLRKNGYLDSWEGKPIEKRGGRAKRFYKLTPRGVEALSRVRSVHDKAWSDLPNLGYGLSPSTS